MERKRRYGKGKQRIEIKKIESEEARQDCFTRRKAGIFSMANEIATLCGAEVAVLIQSPAGRPFTFGSPSVNHVIRRFLNGGVGVNETDEYKAQRLLKIQELNSKFMEARSKYEKALERRKLLVRRIAELCEANEDVRRLENVEDLNIDELRKMAELLDNFKKAVRAKIANDIAAKSGNPILTNLNLSGYETGQCSAKSFTTHDNSNNEGPSHVKGHPILANLNFSGNGTGQWNAKSFTAHVNSNNEGPSRIKDLDINLSLFEGGSLGHFGEPNPIINPNATNVGPNEPQHTPLQKTVSGHELVELDLLGGFVDSAAEKEPK